jgi:hypothetical protein
MVFCSETPWVAAVVTPYCLYVLHILLNMERPIATYFRQMYLCFLVMPRAYHVVSEQKCNQTAAILGLFRVHWCWYICLVLGLPTFLLPVEAYSHRKPNFNNFASTYTPNSHYLNCVRLLFSNVLTLF